MSNHYEYHSQFDGHNGDIVELDGKKCFLRVSVYNAIYPYKHKVISVFAEPINKNDKEYLERKKYLGDDWGHDVLNRPETEAYVLNQLV